MSKLTRTSVTRWKNRNLPVTEIKINVYKSKSKLIASAKKKKKVLKNKAVKSLLF